MPIYEGNTIGDWRTGLDRGASTSPMPPKEKPIKDEMWETLNLLRAKGAQVSDETEEAFKALQFVVGTYVPSAEFYQREAEESLQSRLAAQRQEALSTVETHAADGATFEEMVEAVGHESTAALKQRIADLGLVRKAVADARNRVVGNFHKVAANDKKLTDSLHAMWPERVAYDVDENLTLIEARVMEEGAKELIYAISQWEAMRAGQLTGAPTEQVAKTVRSTIQKIADMKPEDRPKDFPTAETVAESFQSPSAESAQRMDPKTRRRMEREARKEAEKKLAKFWMNDEGRAALAKREAEAEERAVKAPELAS